MGILFTGVQGNILTTLMGNVLTEGMGKVLDIYNIVEKFVGVNVNEVENS